MIIPGFFSDTIGFFITNTFTRKILINFFLSRNLKSKPKNKDNETLEGEIIDKKMSYKIVGKYIKEINFNIPNAKTFFLLSKDISNYKINIDIKSSQIKEKVIAFRLCLGSFVTERRFREN